MTRETDGSLSVLPAAAGARAQRPKVMALARGHRAVALWGRFRLDLLHTLQERGLRHAARRRVRMIAVTGLAVWHPPG